MAGCQSTSTALKDPLDAANSGSASRYEAGILHRRGNSANAGATAISYTRKRALTASTDATTTTRARRRRAAGTG
jgi:hypothetical protein